MVYYYPVSIPNSIDKKSFTTLKQNTYTSTMLYSNEGIFQIKKNKLYAIHFSDDEYPKNITIDDIKYSTDKTITHMTPCNKLPYDFIEKDILVTCYEVGSVKLYIEEEDDEISNLYFDVKDENIYGIQEDVSNLMRKVLKASF
jgi:hypothetical protein